MSPSGWPGWTSQRFRPGYNNWTGYSPTYPREGFRKGSGERSRRSFKILVCVPHNSSSGKGGVLSSSSLPSFSPYIDTLLSPCFRRRSRPLPFPSFPLIPKFFVLLLKTLLLRFASLFLLGCFFYGFDASGFSFLIFSCLLASRRCDLFVVL